MHLEEGLVYSFNDLPILYRLTQATRGGRDFRDKQTNFQRALSVINRKIFMLKL